MPVYILQSFIYNLQRFAFKASVNDFLQHRFANISYLLIRTHVLSLHTHYYTDIALKYTHNSFMHSEISSVPVLAAIGYTCK